VTRRARADARYLGRTLRLLEQRRDRTAHLIGLAALRGPLSVSELARETGRHPRTIRRYRDRAAEIVGTAPTTAPDARADISGTLARRDHDERQTALNVIRQMASGGQPPTVRAYRAAQRDYNAPSVETVVALFGSWRAAVESAGLDPRTPGRPRRRRR